MALYNQRIWEVIKDKVAEEIAAALGDGGAIKGAIDDAVEAHELKEEGDDFANSHVPAGE